MSVNLSDVVLIRAGRRNDETGYCDPGAVCRVSNQNISSTKLINRMEQAKIVEFEKCQFAQLLSHPQCVETLVIKGSDDFHYPFTDRSCSLRVVKIDKTQPLDESELRYIASRAPNLLILRAACNELQIHELPEKIGALRNFASYISQNSDLDLTKINSQLLWTSYCIYFNESLVKELLFSDTEIVLPEKPDQQMFENLANALFLRLFHGSPI